MKTFVCFLIAVALALPAMALEDYNNPFTADARTRALYHFDESSGSTANDAGNSNVDGTLTNLDTNSSWVAGKSGFGNCFETWYTSEADSNAGVIVVADADGVLNLVDDLTIEFWMNPSEAPANFGTIGKKYTGGPWSIGLTTGMNVAFGWYAGGWQGLTDTATAIPTNDWTHVAVIVDRFSDTDIQTIYFFVNGNLWYSGTGPKGGGAGAENVYLLNTDTGGGDTYLYRGKLDELRISNAIRDYGNLVPEVSGIEPFVSD